MSDEVFVGKCRVVGAGVVRLGALWLALQVSRSAVEQISSIAGRMGAVGRAVYGSANDYAALIAMGLTLGGAIAMWFWAGWIARRIFPMPPPRNQCPKCKYPLEGLKGNRCPECGGKVR